MTIALATPTRFRRGWQPGADLFDEIDVDNFAGGGGVGMGFEEATGKAFDVAINHDEAAIAMHAANHPGTRHVCESVWAVDPVELCAGRPVRLAWFSPDCKHFSRAKGAKPVEKKIRGLAWVAVRWAKRTRPRIIMLENVREFLDWGPLTDDNRPCPARKGMTFRRFVGCLRGLGYAVEWKVLNAADYGAPTHRRRLYLVARSDGQPIRWPEPTHAAPEKARGLGLRPYRTAAECIDWSIPCPSIFERKRPLAEKTCRRIARGIVRYVLENPRPFIVRLAHGESAKGSKWQHKPLDIGEPLGTVTASREYALCAPSIVNIERSYKDFAGQSAEVPLGTITASPKGGKHALVSAFMERHTAPVLVGGAEYAGKPRPVDQPRGAVLPNDRTALAAACMVRMNHGQKQWNAVDEPLRTITSQGNKAGLVYAFLTSYYGCERDGAAVDRPVRTITGVDRHGLVTVEVDGATYALVDIGLRMLSPRELARCQGFPDGYVLTGTQSNQVARIGNSVPPQVVTALVRANLPEASARRARRAT